MAAFSNVTRNDVLIMTSRFNTPLLIFMDLDMFICYQWLHDLNSRHVTYHGRPIFKYKSNIFMNVIKYVCNHGNQNNLNAILHGILKQAIIKHNNIHHKCYNLKIRLNITFNTPTLRK